MEPNLLPSRVRTATVVRFDFLYHLLRGDTGVLCKVCSANLKANFSRFSSPQFASMPHFH